MPHRRGRFGAGPDFGVRDRYDSDPVSKPHTVTFLHEDLTDAAGNFASDVDRRRGDFAFKRRVRPEPRPPARESDHEDREEHGEDDDKRVAALIFFFFFSHKRQIADRNSGSAGKDGQSVRRKPLNPALQKPLTAVFPYCRDETSLFASAERRKCDAEPEDR